MDARFRHVTRRLGSGRVGQQSEKEGLGIGEAPRSQLKVTVRAELRSAAKALAKRRRLSLSQLVERLLERSLDEEETGATPDESAIREMSILIAVELGLKLLEASIPGGVTLSKRLVDDAAQAAIARIELVESKLRHGSDF